MWMRFGYDDGRTSCRCRINGKDGACQWDECATKTMAKKTVPLTVLRRLDFVLQPTKGKVLQVHEANKS
jgi:hypothetical protein